MNPLTMYSAAAPDTPMVSDSLVCHYWSGDAIRSRSVGGRVLSGVLDIPAPPARLIADWNRDARLHLGLEPGDVETLGLARARTRWPDYRRCVQAVSGWLRWLGLPDLLATCDIALMACRGAKYHHDGARYGGMAFCNLFLSEDRGLDLHFPHAGDRIPLVRGTVVLFDTGQPHAVITRGGCGFQAADFPPEQDFTQVFLTWEIPIEHAGVGRTLGIDYDVDAVTASRLDEGQLQLNGAPAILCPDTGRWRAPG